MERLQFEVEAPMFDRAGTVIRYGHYGRPVVVFPSEAGRAWDYESNGMVDAVAGLIEAGRVKLYCIDSFDDVIWSDSWVGIEERAARQHEYQNWVTGHVWDRIVEDSPGARDAVATGCSMGAYHALQMCLTRGDLFPQAICLSGNYDPTGFRGWGEPGEAAYFANPTAYVPNLHGDHLDWLRSRINPVLVVGEGAWEVHPTASLPQTRRMAAILAERDIPHELDVWGHDSAHDWPWWHRQIAVHLPRMC